MPRRLPGRGHRPRRLRLRRRHRGRRRGRDGFPAQDGVEVVGNALEGGCGRLLLRQHTPRERREGEGQACVALVLVVLLLLLRRALRRAQRGRPLLLRVGTAACDEGGGRRREVDGHRRWRRARRHAGGVGGGGHGGRGGTRRRERRGRRRRRKRLPGDGSGRGRCGCCRCCRRLGSGRRSERRHWLLECLLAHLLRLLFGCVCRLLRLLRLLPVQDVKGGATDLRGTRLALQNRLLKQSQLARCVACCQSRLILGTRRTRGVCSIVGEDRCSLGSQRVPLLLVPPLLQPLRERRLRSGLCRCGAGRQRRHARRCVEHLCKAFVVVLLLHQAAAPLRARAAGRLGDGLRPVDHRRRGGVRLLCGWCLILAVGVLQHTLSLGGRHEKRSGVGMRMRVCVPHSL
eukprot:Rhum_TRINITY_DN7742_c0_g1::Rhum_TRINITY_DN7742_c0_g1_i1::g.24417::m.24417